MSINLNFYDALRSTLTGCKITRLDWKDVNWYGFMQLGVLCLHKPDGNRSQWILSDGDLIAEDWIVLSEHIQ